MTRISVMASIIFAALACTFSLRAADDKKENPLDETQAERAALFSKLDANHDGQITADEVPEEQRRLFERLLRRADRNGDGKLSREEFLAGMKEMEEHPGQPGDNANGAPRPEGSSPIDHRPADRPGAAGVGRGFGFGGAGGGPLMGMAIFHALDTNGDGKLDAKEIAAAPEALKKLANSNGEITREDLMKSMPGVAAGGFGGGFGAGGFGGGLAGSAGQGEPNSEAVMKRVIQTFDKNGDGKLQKDELPPKLQERFDELDTNHDGALDEAELKAILPRLMRRMEEERGKNGSRPEHRQATDAKSPDTKDSDGKTP
jgi:Ca2+-binding EF-hand superfamily protein